MRRPGPGTDPGTDPGAALIDIPAADLPMPSGPPGPDASAASGSPAERPTLTYSIPLLILLATATGLVTGFLGVGGGFLVVPALVLSLRMPVANATATGLVVIAIASTSALLVRLTHSGTLDQPALTAGSSSPPSSPPCSPRGSPAGCHRGPWARGSPPSSWR